AGATLVLERMDAYLPGLAALCRAVELETDGSAWPNLYWTPPRARGFDAHRDDHDVFILQIHGTKQWTLYAMAPPLPDGEQEGDHPRPPGKVSARCLLRPGDLLYIPRGLAHSAKSGARDSLHVTLGLRLPTWKALLQAMI